MRSSAEMHSLILNFAENDDRVRLAFFNSTRVDENYCDEYSDFDLVLGVKDIGSFTKSDSWLDVFGPLLIMQKTADELNHPYDYSGNDNYVYLMQFCDGNRIDLTLVDTANIEYELSRNCEPRKVLVNKDGYEAENIAYKGFYKIDRPVERQFDEAVNEFWWMSVTSAKGLCRGELLYVKAMMENYQFGKFWRMLDWLIGVRTNFKAEHEKFAKNIHKYLSYEENEKLAASFGGGDIEEIWQSLFCRCEFFSSISHEVGGYFSFPIKERERDIINHIKMMKQGKAN